MEVSVFVAAGDDKGARLDVFLADKLPDISRSRIKGCIEMGMVKVRGEQVSKAGYPLKEGDLVEIAVADAVELSVEPENLPLNIVYQDSDFAVINKAQGMVTHPAAGSPDGTLVNAVLYHIKDLSGINGVLRPGIVHRLDKDTSGLILIAKNDCAHLSLTTQIAEKTAKRFYIALVDGNVKADEGVIEQPVDRNPKDRKKMAVVKDGRPAKTAYKVLERFGRYTLMEFELFTGRTHQIRVHCAYMRHPVVGDPLYGGSNAFGLKGQLLHAARLVVNHPSTGERMEFTAPLPDYFREVLAKLRKTLA
ncbi:MAG: RluA family pseudouridine synthase [Firmicutes bacterium]|uniref:Pseudouridine synthase n=1 Tax=Candidatus Stercoripulliclostridium pullicola TaxID=2840953 RepID=A0A940DGC7_9FIRM|nr:RluA family pseudouridine synthase [Candidatus Stercoripulliclostridium pullicola]